MNNNGDHLPELPPRWSWGTASELCQKIQDGTHFSPKAQLDSGPHPYVTAKNIRPGGLDLRDMTYLDEATHRTIFKRCDPAPGDVLLVKDGVNAGDAALHTYDGEISLLSSVCFLRTHKQVLNGAFLRYFLQSPTGHTRLTGEMTGTAIRRIILKKVRTLPIPVAPFDEQHRIVAEIEKQFSRLDAGVPACTKPPPRCM